MKTPPPTQTYVLRCWQSYRPEEGVQWRFRVEVSLTGEEHHFRSLEALLNFLRERFSPEPDTVSPDGEV